MDLNLIHMRISKTNIDLSLENDVPDQFLDAIDFTNDIRHQFGGANIIHTGHSLGGAIANYIVCKESHNKDDLSAVDRAVSFNAPDIRQLLTNNLSEVDGWLDTLSNIVDNKQIQQFNRKGDIISISGLMTFLNIAGDLYDDMNWQQRI